MMNINTLDFVNAMCPFCREFITGKARIMQYINLTGNRELLSELLRKGINYMVCPKCGEEFYYEQNCLVLNSEKNYAVASTPSPIKLNDEKSALYHILKKSDFRMRYVDEFIYLTEKIRIFEFNLDDRALEIVKYNYMVKPMNLGTDAKIILTGADGNALIFTVFDHNDKPLSTHRVVNDAYKHTVHKLEKELVSESMIHWRKINLSWAEQYIKENKLK